MIASFRESMIGRVYLLPILYLQCCCRGFTARAYPSPRRPKSNVSSIPALAQLFHPAISRALRDAQAKDQYNAVIQQSDQ